MKSIRNLKLVVVITLVVAGAEAVRMLVHGVFSLSRFGGALLERLPEVVLGMFLYHFCSPDPRRLPDADEKPADPSQPER